MDCCLVPTTLSGVTLKVSLSIAKLDRFADLEDHVMDCLISVTDLKMFFPRVRTPCGHGAQVIIEGKEKQSDGGEKDKSNPTTNQTSQNRAHRPSLHHLVVFPLY